MVAERKIGVSVKDIDQHEFTKALSTFSQKIRKNENS